MKKIILFLCLFGLSCCGSIATNTANQDTTDIDSSISANLSAYDSLTYIFATDYQSSGQLYFATLLDNKTTLENSGVTMLGTEAIIRYENSLLYILHAGAGFNSVSTDNLQIIDPLDVEHPFTTIAQYSTGNGTNPQDVIIDNDVAFISLYNPSNDPNNVTSHNQPGDVIEMDLNTGQVLHRYAFYDYLADDGDRNAHASHMVQTGNFLYVCLQDLESNTFTPSAPGLIGMIDMVQHKVTGVITLQSRNPYDIAINNDETKLYISSTYNYQYDGTFGGLEIVDLKTQTSELFIPDNEFSGYIEKIRKTDDGFFAIISRFNLDTFTFDSKLIHFAEDIHNSTEISPVFDFGTDIRDAFVHNGYLWVSYRVISTTEGDSTPNIKVFDALTGEQVGEPLYPVVAGVSITG